MSDAAPTFAATLAGHGLALRASRPRVLQMNVTRLCNQACRHCHVGSSPRRTEAMSEAVLDRCLELVSSGVFETLDLTGGAPELHPGFADFVARARPHVARLIVRHNLTVTLDPHPRTGASMEHLPAFFAGQRVDLVSSLPFHQESLTDRQRGGGVFEKSVESLRRLNAAGYGDPATGLVIDLVYNPVGAYLPAPQADLQRDYERELGRRWGLRFNRLLALTNMPIERFREDLQRRGALEAYMGKLRAAFNPAAVAGLMCRDTISVDHVGGLHDCDFNQMLALGVEGPARTVFDLDPASAVDRVVRTGDHCFGCTAGSGSSCGGAIAKG